MVTFLSPKFVAQEIFPLSNEQMSALSKDVSVIRLECGDHTFEVCFHNTMLTILFKMAAVICVILFDPVIMFAVHIYNDTRVGIW